MSTKTMKEKAVELLQKCEVVTLASVNKEGYPRPVPMSKIAAAIFLLTSFVPAVELLNTDSTTAL